MKRLALLLSLVLLVGCASAAPAPLRFEEQDLADAAQVAHVTMRKGQELLSYARPLWGDREEDQPKIAHILRLIRLAEVAEAPLGSRDGLDDAGETLLTVQYTDGRLVQVGLVYKPRRTGGLESVRGRLYVPGVGEVIAPELDQFYRGAARVRRADLLVPVSPLEVATRRTSPGGKVTVYGEGWVGVDRIAVVLVESGTGQRWHLGEVSVERGVFVWRGVLPGDVKPGARRQHSFVLEAEGKPVGSTVVEIVGR